MFKRTTWLFFILLIEISTSFATHLMGGNMSYKYIGPVVIGGAPKVKYKVMLKAYRDCGQSTVDFDPTITVGVYSNTGSLPKSFDATLNLISKTKVPPPWNSNCPQFNSLNYCVEEGYFEGEIFVDPSPNGYHLYYQRCCRNKQVNARDDEGQGYYAFIPNTSTVNNSPDFTRIPTPVICVNDTIDVENSATDPDGDSLVYTLAWPLDGGSSSDPMPTPPPLLPNPLQNISYNAGYSYLKPFGNAGVCIINSMTGLGKYYIPQKGLYSVAIEILEFRNGKYLGKIRRDVQIIATDLCTPNQAPRLTSGLQGTQSAPYNIVEGDKLCFTTTFRDSAVQSLTLTAYGDPINGTGGVQSPLATMPSATGLGSVSTEFCWQTGCNHGRSLPYIVYLEVKDNGCPEKKTLVTYFVNVKPFVATSLITGDTIVCLNKKGIKYTVPNPNPNYQYQWTVQNGNLVSGQGTSSIFVDFNSIGQAKIILQMKNQAGCEATPDTQDIVVLPPVNVKPVSGDTALCEFSKGKPYNIPSTAGSTYTWVAVNGTIVNGQGTNAVTVDWGVRGTGYVGVVETSKYGCPSDTMYLFVNLYRADPGPIEGSPSVCPHVKGVVYKVRPTSGSQYFWTILGGTQVGGGTSDSIIVNWGLKGIGVVKCVEVNKFGCVSDTIFYNVLIDHALIGEVPVGDTIVCAYTVGVPYEVHYTSNSTYTWTVTGGTIISGQGTHLIFVNWGGPGAGDVSVVETSFDSVSNLPCISQPNILNVRVAPLPQTSEISGPMEFCESKLEKVYVANGAKNSTYRWKLDGSDLSFSGDSAVLIFDVQGNYTLSVQEITVDSCIGDVFDTVIVIHPNPITTGIFGDTFICQPNFSNHPYGVDGFLGSSYNWYVYNGVVNSGAGSDSVVIDWTGLNPAWISVNEVTQFGCVGDTLKLKVYMDKPGIQMQYVTVGEKNEEVIEVYWETINAPFYDKPFRIYRRLAGSKDSFEMVGTVDSAARMFTDIKVDVYSHAYEYFVEGYDLCGQPMRTNVHTTMWLTGLKVDGYDTKLRWSRYYGWSSGVKNFDVIRRMADDLDYAGYEATLDTFTYYQNGFDSWQQCYRIKAMKRGGTFVSYSNRLCFTFDPILWIPNAFTPNDDRVNDFYELKGGSLKKFEITIYNRWGEKLFYSENLGDSWDGTFKGKPCQADAYVYIVKYSGFDNIQKLETGSLQLLR